MLTSASVKNLARSVGFDLCGIADPQLPSRHSGRLDEWLGRGYQADMNWMQQTRQKRINPALCLPGVRSVIMLGVNYFQQNSESRSLRGRVARYARGRDYHKVLARMIRHLIAKLEELARPDKHRFFWYVDYGPLMERAFAEKAGMGFIGKNSMLITREFGSWIFLAEILTTVDLEADDPHAINHGRCGKCRLCIDACPTGAIVGDGLIDATRCISYLTVERPGKIDKELAQLLGNQAFGCDICQEICPHNCRAKESCHHELLPPSGVGEWIDLKAILEMSSRREFLDLTAGTALTRPRLDGLQRTARNILDSYRPDQTDH
jgi:epoxyqueuosine reductase